MPESPIRIYLPEKRPADVRPRQPHWFSAEVSAAVLTQLQNIGPTANWNEAINGIALAATGRYTPVIGDIVTLYRGAESFQRTWDGFRWVYIEPFMDGDHIYAESILAHAIAANTIEGGAFVANSIEADKIRLNSLAADNIDANAVTASKLKLDEGILTRSIQIGARNVSFTNLSEEIIAPISSIVFYEPIQRFNGNLSSATAPTADLTLTTPTIHQGANVLFTRNSANEELKVYVRMIGTLSAVIILEISVGTGTVAGTLVERRVLNPVVDIDTSRWRSHERLRLLNNPQIYHRRLQEFTIPPALSPIGQQYLVFLRVGLYTLPARTQFSNPTPDAHFSVVIQEARPFG